jgi:hypothetical protein
MAIINPLPSPLGNQKGNFTLSHSIRYEFSTALPLHHYYVYRGTVKQSLRNNLELR